MTTLEHALEDRGNVSWWRSTAGRAVFARRFAQAKIDARALWQDDAMRQTAKLPRPPRYHRRRATR